MGNALDARYHILVITGDASEAERLADLLDRSADGPFEVEVRTRLSTGLDRIHRGGIDAVLVNLSLPDSQGIETFDKLFTVAPYMPMMTIAEDSDLLVAREAVQRGAQGYLQKSSFESYLVSRSLRNMIERKAFENGLMQESARATVTLNSISDAVIGTDLAGNIDYLNLAAEKMTGWSREEARDRPIAEVMKIVTGTTRQSGQNPIELVLENDEKMALAADTVLIRRDGIEIAIEDSAAPIHDTSGKMTGAVIVFHDITAARAMAMKMAYLAQHDFLTKLPNRILLSDRIAQAISIAERHRTGLAVLFLDLDNFKHINDSLGHRIGDKLLQSVASRLSHSVRALDTVSRQGGDEFIILLPDDQDAKDAATVARSLIAALDKPHHVDGHDLHVTASIGISTFPDDAADAEGLMQHADSAMYRAKEKGRNGYEFYDRSMTARAVERQTIEADLRHAVKLRQFLLYYQPIVELASGVIIGAEALLRWRHPIHGLVLPDRFVPVAEGCGLIAKIGRWVLAEACGQVQRWDKAGWPLRSIAVNVSPVEFRRDGYVDGVRAVLEETGLEPGRLVLEITESVLLDNPKSASILQELSDMGVKLAVDDFGIGYSSLGYLTRFPVDILKIDRSLVEAIDTGKDHGLIASAIIAISHPLGLDVVAEGVERTTQVAFLTRHGCKNGQGHLFSKAVAPESFTEFLTNGIPPKSPPARFDHSSHVAPKEPKVPRAAGRQTEFGQGDRASGNPAASPKPA